MRHDGTCTSCQARIRWATLDGTTRLIPLDNVAREDGNIGIVAWGPLVRGWRRPIVQVNPTGPTETPYRYVTHFATCPNADEHRHADKITGGHA